MRDERPPVRQRTSRSSACSERSTRAAPRSRCRSSTVRTLGDGQPGQHEPGLTKKWDRRAEQVLPDRRAQLRPRRRNRRHPGPGGRSLVAGHGLKKVYVLNDKQTYGFGVATTYKNAAKKLGIKVVGFQGWDAKQSSYEALATAIKASGAQAVFLGGIVCNNGAKLMQDIKSVDPKIQLQMPDGFSDPGANGAVGNGAYISVAGEPPNASTGPARRSSRASASRSARRRTRTPPTAHRRWTSCCRQSRRAAASGRRRRRASSASRSRTASSATSRSTRPATRT